MFGLSLFSSFYYTGHLDKDNIDINNINYSKGLGNEKEYFPKSTIDNKEYLENRTNDITITSGKRKYKINFKRIPKFSI